MLKLSYATVFDFQKNAESSEIVEKFTPFGYKSSNDKYLKKIIFIKNVPFTKTQS